MKSAKISSSQLLMILLVCRVFTLMTFVPFAGSGGFNTQLCAALISSAIQALLIIPLALFGRAYPEKSVTCAVSEKSRPFGIITAAAYLLFFLVYAVSSAVHFMRFLNARFLDSGSFAAITLIFTAVCVYCAHCGIEGLCRSSTLIAVFFAAVFIVIGFSSINSFDTENFNFYGVKNSLPGAVLYDLSKNGEITAAAFLLRHTKEKRARALYGLIGAKLIVTELVTALIIGVLGSFGAMADYPFLEAGAFSGAGNFQRADSLYLILWTLAAVINVSLFIGISAGTVKEIFPKLRQGALISGAAVFISSSVILYYGADISLLRKYICGGASVILLTGIIPLIMFFAARGKKKNVKA